jgi:membrane protein YdbS with pleckstrin-like domain
MVLGSGATLLGLRLAWVIVSPPLAYRRWRFAVADPLMLVRYGIIFHGERAIPISRLQHVDLLRGPVERLFGLATLIVHTAGTEDTSFRLPGLAPATAQALRDQLLAARGDDRI